jgi:hypothetical protein
MSGIFDNRKIVLLDNFLISFKSKGYPPQSTHTTALVLELIRFSISPESRVQDSYLTSAKTGFAPR